MAPTVMLNRSKTVIDVDSFNTQLRRNRIAVPQSCRMYGSLLLFHTRRLRRVLNRYQAETLRLPQVGMEASARGSSYALHHICRDPHPAYPRVRRGQKSSTVTGAR